MSVLPVVQQLRGLAEKEANRRTIVQNDGCLPGLVLFLDNPDKDVIKTAVEALSFLAECDANHSDMKRELGLLISLKDISKNEDMDVSLRAMATEIVRKITAPKRAGRRVFAVRNARSALSDVSAAVKKPSTSIFNKSTNNYLTPCRTVVLKIEGLDDMHARRVLEGAFIELSGIISFTFDMKKSTVTIRARECLETADMIRVVAETNLMTARPVIRDGKGEEVVLKYGSSPSKAPRAPPKYLDDDEEDGVDDGSPQHGSENDENANAVTIHEKSKNTTWFSSLGDYFSKALYW